MRFARTDRSVMAEWWFTVDRVLLTAILVLVGTGAVLSLAASPAVAIKKGLNPFYFVERHTLFALMGAALIVAASLLSPRALRRVALAVLVVALASMVAVLLVGPEINGSQRWLRYAGYSLQPSEFAKPAFVLISAWLLDETRKRTDVPAMPLALGLYGLMVVLLILEPDVGQTILITLVWGILFFFAGQPLKYVLAFALTGLGALGLAYATLGHVRSRIERYLDPSSGDSYQLDRALQSFTEGGFFGRGPGEGTIKAVLPDSHTDFIFAVLAEEYGIVACLILAGLFAFIVFRGLNHIWVQPDGYVRNATIGLVMLFGLQALINMAVNVGLAPAKGMTLPFISYGGSSLLAMSMTMGALIALTRRRPGGRDGAG